jgi:hypothetical protein
MKPLFIAVVPTLALACVMALTGCSSTPTVQAQKPQYCYTSQTIKTQNGEQVNSETTLDCTDDQTKRLSATRMGLSQSCGEFTYWTKIGGRDVQRKGISCQRPDGSWEIVNTVGRL